MTQNERIDRLGEIRRGIHAEEARHRLENSRLLALLRETLKAPGCTHKEKDGTSAEENVSDHGSSYKCFYCQLLGV